MAERLIAAVLKTVEGNTSGGSNPSLSADSLRQKATKDRQTVQIERFGRFFCVLWLLRKTVKGQIKPVYISQFVPHKQIRHKGVRIVRYWQFDVHYWQVYNKLNFKAI